MSLVSIIVPNYNHERYLEKRLDSIFGQTYRDFEVVLLDDCSNDGSMNILSPYRERTGVIALVKSAKNSGSPFGQWRKGLSMSSGKYIWIAESDDFADERFLEVMVPVLESNPAVGMAFCRSAVVDEQGCPVARGVDKVSRDEPADKSFTRSGIDFLQSDLYYKCAIPNVSSAVFRRSIFNEVNFVPDHYRFTGDWLFWIRFFESGAGVSYVDQRLNFFRKHQQTTRVFHTGRKFADYMAESFSILDYAKKTGRADRRKIERRMDFLANRISNQFPASSFFRKEGLSLIRRLVSYDHKIVLRIAGKKMGWKS